MKVWSEISKNKTMQVLFLYVTKNFKANLSNVIKTEIDERIVKYILKFLRFHIWFNEHFYKYIALANQYFNINSKLTKKV